MGNPENLIQNKDRTPEELREITRKGGIASGKKRRERKAMREQLEMLLNLPLKNEKSKEQIKKLGIKNTDINNQMAITIALFQKALSGDAKAYELIRDTLGEKPIDKVQNINPPIISIQRPDTE